MNKQAGDGNGSVKLRSGWIVVLVVALAAAIGQSFGRFSFGILLPAIRDDLNISNTVVGLVGASNVGAYLLGTLVVAWATSRYRLIQVMRLGVVLATFGLLVAAVAGSPWMLAFSLFVTGIGGAFLWIPAPVIAADAMPVNRRSLAVGMMSSGIGLGVMFASVVSGGLRSSQGDSAWSSVYIVQFVAALVVLILTAGCTASAKFAVGWWRLWWFRRVAAHERLVAAVGSVFGLWFYVLIGDGVFNHAPRRRQWLEFSRCVLCFFYYGIRHDLWWSDFHHHRPTTWCT